MLEVDMSIWGRTLPLAVQYEVPVGSPAKPEQVQALSALLQKWNRVEESQEAVKQYCLTNNADVVKEDDVKDIFRLVVPKAIYILDPEEGHGVAIMCEYLCDLKNGLAVVFRDEQLDKICTQTEVLGKAAE